MAELFRVVKYYNSPRNITMLVMHIPIIGLAASRWIPLSQITAIYRIIPLGNRLLTILVTFWYGKQPHNYGTSPFLMGKSTINGPFSIAILT